MTPHYTVRCDKCETPFPTDRLDDWNCKRCGSGPRKTRRHRGQETGAPIPPRRVPELHLCLPVDEDEHLFSTLDAAQDWIDRNVDPRHNGRRTIMTIEGYRAHLASAERHDAA